MGNEEQSAQVSEAAKKVFESRGFPSEAHAAHVERIKEKAAILWDEINTIPTGNSEAPRLVAKAKTELEDAVMWAVKAISRF